MTPRLGTTIVLAGLSVGALAACNGSAPPRPNTVTFLHDMRAHVPAERQHSDRALIQRGHAICGILKPGNPPTWKLAREYLVSRGIPPLQATFEIDYASEAYCHNDRSSLGDFADVHLHVQ